MKFYYKQTVWLVILAFIFSSSSFAQEDSKITKVKRKKTRLETENYSRSSLTYLLLDNIAEKSKYKKDIEDAFENATVNTKFDDNNDFIDARIYEIKAPKKQLSEEKQTLNKGKSFLKHLTGIKLYQNDSMANVLNTVAMRDGIADELIYRWYGIDRNGTIHQEKSVVTTRGFYNATDKDAEEAKIKKRGLASLEDQGADLIANSHILFLEFENVQSMKEYYAEQEKLGKQVKRNKNGYKGNLTAYLFRINFDTEYRTSFENAISEDQSFFDKQKYEQALKLANNQNRFTFVAKVEVKADGTQPNPPREDTQKAASILKKYVKIPKQKSKEELFAQLVKTGIDNALFEISRSYENFKTKSFVTMSSKKIGAKIGTKEGLKMEDRFFIWTPIWNEKTASLTYKRKGVVRAKQPIDNVNTKLGETDTTLFYQIAGKKIDDGWVLQQANDLGMGLELGYKFGGFGGFTGRFEYNPSKILKQYVNFPIRDLKLWVEISLQSKEYDNAVIDNAKGKYSFMMYSIGLSKDFYFLRNYAITPFASYGAESASSDELLGKGSISTALISLGTRLSRNILYNLQIVGSVYYYIPTNVNISDYEGNTYTTPYLYSDFFDGRKGVSFSIGLRYQL